MHNLYRLSIIPMVAGLLAAALTSYVVSLNQAESLILTMIPPISAVIVTVVCFLMMVLRPLRQFLDSVNDILKMRDTTIKTEAAWLQPSITAINRYFESTRNIQKDLSDNGSHIAISAAEMSYAADQLKIKLNEESN